MKKRRTISLIVMLCLMIASLIGAVACDGGHTHSYGDWYITTKPTMEVGGKASHSCSECGGAEEVEIPALSDSSVWTKDSEKSVPSNHTAEGKDVYTSEYGDVTVTTPKSDAHIFGAWTMVKEPTLTEVGQAQRKCQANDDGVETKEVPALSDGTVWTKDAQASVPATHAVGGTDVYTSEYGKVSVKTEKSTEHTYGAWTITKNPTLTEKGTAERYCTLNDGGKDTREIESLSTASVWTKDTQRSKPATHDAGGVDVYTSEYGTVYVNTDPAGHTYGAWSIHIAPTLDKGGFAKRECSEDGDVEYKAIPELTDGTVWTKNVKTPASHTASGLDEYTSEYGTVEIVTDPTAEHTYGAWEIVQEPTLTAGGTAKHTCQFCDHSETVEISALNNTEVWTKDAQASTSATHTAQGTDVYTSVYGSVSVTTPKDPTHTYGEWHVTKAPTLTDGGTAQRECTADDNARETKALPNLSDTEFWTKDEAASTPATHTKVGHDIYKNEEFSLTVTLDILGNPEHSFGPWTWVDGIEPTATSGAKIERSCILGDEDEPCSEREEREVPTLASSFWTRSDESYAADYEHEGKDIYTNSEYDLRVEVTHPRIPAPYEGKTYYSGISINICDNDDVTNGNPKNSGTSWTNSMTVDSDGVGYGSGMPFSPYAKYEFKLVDPVTGEISITSTKGTQIPDSDDYEYTINPPKTVKAYMDMVSGIIIMPNNESLSYFHLVSPYGVYTSSNKDFKFAISSWGLSEAEYYVALSYTYKVDGEEKTVTAYIHNEVVTFGVSFEGAGGSKIAADEAYGSPVLYVVKDGVRLLSVGYNENAAEGNKMAALDGYEGYYSDLLLNRVYLSGFGAAQATMSDGSVLNGEYFIMPGDYLELLLTDEEGVTKCYASEITSANVLSSRELNVRITYNVKGVGEAPASELVAKRVKHELPVLEDANNFFGGWYLDDACTQPVPEEFVPTEDTTLYAKWVMKLTITVYTTYDGKTSVTLTVGVGENILDVLNGLIDKKFVDGYAFRDEWKMGEYSVEESMNFSAENNNAVFTSVWVYAPYVGEYKGSEIYNAGYGSSEVNITIDADGKISGSKDGTVISYDEKTQIISWEDTSNKVLNFFFFDVNSGVLAFNEDGSTYQYLGTDMFVLSKYATTNSITTKFGVKAEPKHEGGSRNWYAQFVEIETKTGKKTVFIYDTFIYSDVTVTDAFGNALTVSQIKNSKSVVVKDSKGGILLKVASQGNSFSSKSDTKDLDAYYGTYTKDGAEDLKLDGMGNLMLGTKTGTYEEIDDSTIGAYVTEEDTTVYYEITLDGSSYESTKAMVTVNFDYGVVTNPDGTPEGNSFNKNIELSLPVLEDPNGVYLFRGWYLEADCTNSVEVPFKPSTEITLYAKWIKKVTITLHLDGATLPEGSLGANGTIDTFGQGEAVTLLRPSKEGKKFGGWFTDAQFGTPWGEMKSDGSTSVTLAEGDVVAIDLYPKWDEAPAYSGEYKLYHFDDKGANGGVENPGTYNTNVVIDAEGFLAKTSGTDWPFTSYDMQVSGLESGDGEFQFLYSTGTSSKYFDAAYDSASGIITLIARGNDYGDMFVFVPVSKLADATVTNSHWKSGKIRAITVEKDGVKHNIFLSGNKAYFGVTFVDKDGVSVAAEEAYHTPNRFYVRKDGAPIEGVMGYGYNGTTMVELDGWEGEYTYAGSDDEFNFGTIEINGTGTLTTADKKSGNYSLVKDKDYTAELRLEGVFYYLTLTLNPENNTYTIVKPMATITYVLVDATGGTSITSSNNFALSGSQNLNVQFTLGVPEVDGYVFRGWYTTANKDWSDSEKLSMDTSGNYVYTPTEMSVTLYARFLKVVTLTLRYGNDMEDVVIKLGAGESVGNIKPSPMPADPTVVNQKKFLGWYQDEACESKWETSYLVNEDKIIYAKWSETLGDVNYMPDESEEATKWVEEGDGWKSNNYHQSSKTSTLEILFTAEGTYSFHYYAQSERANWDYLKIVHKHEDGSEDTLVNNVGGSSGMEGDLSVEVMPGDTLVLTYRKDNGGDGGDDLARISKIVWEKTIYDEFEGAYTGSRNEEPADLILNGKGGVSWAGRAGTYHAKEDQENVIEVTLEKSGDSPAEYWVITLTTEGDSKTYVAVMPKVSVSFSIEDGDFSSVTPKTENWNITIPVALPEVETDTKYIEGWYTEATCSEESKVALDENGMYVPNGEESVMLYGKVVNKLTVTLHYNGHGESPNGTKVLYYKNGATPDLSNETPGDNSEPKNYFTGWYNEVDCTTAYVPAPLTANIDVYAGWSTTPYSVEITTDGSSSIKWADQGDGVYRVDAVSTCHAYIKITFKASGTFKFDWSCQYSDEDGNNYLTACLNKDPYKEPVWSLPFKETSGSGEQKSFEVKAGDTLWIASLVIWAGSSGDYAQVSNFNFVAG